jgi:hypothetical protein
MSHEEKCTIISREKETLTTQVVRRSHLKKRRKASPRFEESKLSEGHGKISEEE